MYNCNLYIDWEIMGKKRILVIDDEAGQVDLLKTFLEETGQYEVRGETQGKMALAAAKEFGPQLIILDEMMPGISGSEICTQLESEPETRDIPVVFLTGILSKEEADSSGGEIAGRAFLAKPVSLEDLIRFVEQHVRA